MAGIVQTGGVGIPRPRVEHPDVAPGTPIALIGLWLQALRYRFNRNPAEPLPWVWDANLRPDEDENEYPIPEGEPRKLLIEAAFNVAKEQRNYRPAIYVDRGDITPLKTHVDNFVGERLHDQYRAFHSLANMPMSFDVEGENPGESCLVADTAWMFILATRDIFRHDFGLHEITNPVMGATRPKEEDKEVWVTTITFNIQFDLRWTTRPIAPLLNEISVAIREEIEQGGNAETYFHKIALRDLDG